MHVKGRTNCAEMKRFFSISLLVLAFATHTRATTYYVDFSTGQDSSDGTSADHPWKTLDKVNAARFQPGDRILFRSGQTWTGQLAPKSSGADHAPIVIDRYGDGSKPKIDGQGTVEDAIRLYNVQQIEVHDLEVTNHGAGIAKRIGVHIFLDNFGTARHILLTGLYIHDVNGTNGNGDNSKDNGGIIFRTIGDKTPSRFDGLTIERNLIRTVDRSGIAADSYHWNRTRWFPSLHVVIRDNYVDDAGGDGIVPWATDGALIEHNIVRNCNHRAGSYNAGIWPWSTDHSVFQLNEASLTHTTLDGEGFDSDYNSHNTLFQYNYSHDNDGGFMLICTPGKRNERENVGNIGTEIRWNISRNDHARAFNLAGGVEHTRVHDNAIYIGPGIHLEVLLVSQWDGWPHDAVFRDNTVWAAAGGVAEYGHEVKRNDNGTYEIEPEWGGATDIGMDGNESFLQKISSPPAVDWNEPEFDTTKPDGFDEFITAHRAWILRLFEQQFGTPVTPHLESAP